MLATGSTAPVNKLYPSHSCLCSQAKDNSIKLLDQPPPERSHIHQHCPLPAACTIIVPHATNQKASSLFKSKGRSTATSSRQQHQKRPSSPLPGRSQLGELSTTTFQTFHIHPRRPRSSSTITTDWPPTYRSDTALLGPFFKPLDTASTASPQARMPSLKPPAIIPTAP